AARRSRERKAAKVQTLETQVTHLEHLNQTLQINLARSEKERTLLASREHDHARRIAQLEGMLKEAHEALMARAVDTITTASTANANLNVNVPVKAPTPNPTPAASSVIAFPGGIVREDIGSPDTD
ncbi:hypothetical protein HKX48_003276, partial [Thoreauomyces humboldtii]